MSITEKLIKRFKTLPTDFTFEELEKLLNFFGYERSNKGKTSGSRVVFKNKEKVLNYFISLTLGMLLKNMQ